MDIFRKKVFSDSYRCAVQWNSKRYRGKINIRKPRPPHFEKARLFEFAKPFFPSYYKNKTIEELCNINEQKWNKEVDNPYERLIAKDLYHKFLNSKLIGFYHENPFKGEDKHRAIIMFKKNNMYLENYGRKTMEMAVKGTPFEVVLEIHKSRNATVFSSELNLNKMLAITKKFPQLVLMAGIFDGKFVSKDELLYYGNIPNLQTAQLGLVQTLDSIGTNIVKQLTCHQTNLVNMLEERVKQLELENKK